MIFTLMGYTGGSKASEALLGTHRTLPNSVTFLSGVLDTVRVCPGHRHGELEWVGVGVGWGPWEGRLVRNVGQGD